MIDSGKALCVTFIDYSVTFDSVSHRFLHRSLKVWGHHTRAVRFSEPFTTWQFCINEHVPVVNMWKYYTVVLIENDFSCSDSVSVSIMNRNKKILMTLDCFVSITHNSQSPWNVLLKILISDRNLRVVLIQPTVLLTLKIKFLIMTLNIILKWQYRYCTVLYCICFSRLYT